MTEVTRILSAIEQGEPSAAEQQRAELRQPGELRQREAE
jgi:hypothetical protein